MLKGSLVALITPFRDGKVDEKAFQSFVDWQIEQGTEGVVPCGTTGESPTLSHAEHKRVVELCVEVCMVLFFPMGARALVTACRPSAAPPSATVPKSNRSRLVVPIAHSV